MSNFPALPAGMGWPFVDDDTGEFQSTAVKGWLDGRYAHPSKVVGPNTWSSLGDSISARATPALNGGGGYDQDRMAWQHHANVCLGQRLEPVVSYAVSGKKSQQVIDEQLPQVLASPTTYCTILVGTNDLNDGLSASDVYTRLAIIIDALVTAGIRPIVGEITPRTGLSSGQYLELQKVNAWIRSAAPALGAWVVSWFSALANTDGTPKTNVHGDGLHPTAYGASIMGRVFAEAVGGLIPAVDRLPASNGESPGIVLVDNPMMTGTGGSAASGGTGQVASNWQVAGAAGAAYSAVMSKVDRGDDIPGQWQQAVISGDTSAQIYQAETDTSRWTTGDQVYGLFEVESDADLTDPTSFIAQVLCQPSGRSSTALQKVGGDSYTGPVIVPRAGVLRTPIVTIPSGTTQVWALIRTAGSDGTFRVGRVSVQRVT